MIQAILSPAKKLDTKAVSPVSEYSQGAFLEEASELNKVLKEKSPNELSELMKISDKLAQLNWQRNQEWQLPFDTENAQQAVYLFNGDAYVGLDAHSIPNEKVAFLQKTLRILSGQYGILKPLDLIQPYRLEMGTKLAFKDYKNLYDFWGSKITDSINKELKENDYLVNLASNEYFKVINVKDLKPTIITPVFKDFKNGELKVISFFAKKARGAMVRYMVDKQVAEIEELKNFNTFGYLYDAKLSSEKEWVFTR